MVTTASRELLISFSWRAASRAFRASSLTARREVCPERLRLNLLRDAADHICRFGKECQMDTLRARGNFWQIGPYFFGREGHERGQQTNQGFANAPQSSLPRAPPQ